MAILVKGETFVGGSNPSKVTSSKLNNLVDNATFDTGAVDDVTVELSGGAIQLKDGGITLSKLSVSSVLGAVYPVGSIYINATDDTNPASLLGFGTWVAFGEGRVMIGVGTGTDGNSDTLSTTSGEETGGEYNHTLTEDEMPSHIHSLGSFRAYDDAGSSTDGPSGSNDASTTDETQSTGGDQAHNNTQPYISVYMWKRTA